MKVIKNILNIILSFLLIILIFAVMVSNVLKTKILNKDYVLSKLDETEFYLQISREVESGFEKYIYQSGLPEDTIKDLFTDEMIKKDVGSILDKVYIGTDISLSSDQVEENLNNKINKYLESQDIKLNNQGKDNIKKFEKLIIQEYKNNVNVSSTVYDKGHNGIETLNKLNQKVGNIPLIALVAVSILLIIINIKNLLIAINYVGISLLSLGVILKLGVNIILENISIDNILILSTSLSNLLINIIKDILYSFADNSTIFIVCGLVAIIISAILNNVGKEEKN